MIIEAIYKLYPNVVKTMGEHPNITCFDAAGAEVSIDDTLVQNEVNAMLKVKDDEAIISLYDAAMLTLQNGYTDEEVKTFTPKQDAIREYTQVGGILGAAGLSADNRAMMEGLTGSTDDAVIAAKLDNMVAAASAFKNYLGVIEKLRDDHLAQIVEGQDNSAVIASLQAAYAALG